MSKANRKYVAPPKSWCFAILMEGTNLPFTKIKPEDVLYRIVSRRDVEKIATQHPIYEKYLASSLGKSPQGIQDMSTMELGQRWKKGAGALVKQQ